jgi:hypothetical protein
VTKKVKGKGGKIMASSKNIRLADDVSEGRQFLPGIFS